jgi:quercetin dioxygenase-like cupin family protein
MRPSLLGTLALVASTLSTPVLGQATTRSCDAMEQPGPACLLGRKELPSLPAGPLFWHLDVFATRKAAEQAAGPTSTIAEAFGSTWLFTIERAAWSARGGRHVSEIGPLAVPPSSTYAAEYLRSIFKPGAAAPLHVHSGPEAFYAVSGDTCLETPDGVQIGRGLGNALSIKAGPPMLLMAIGKTPRRGFALILHDAAKPPTTLTQAWQPTGFCAQQLSADQASSSNPP